MTSRIALFGGTFDPVHSGHLNSATGVLDALRLDKLIFVPNKVSPLKRDQPVTPGHHRLEMVRLAIGHDRRLGVSDYEVNRPPPSFTIDTVMHFRTEFGHETDLFWIIGADSLGELAGWHRIEDLVETCQIVTVARPGWAAPDLTPLRALLGEGPIRKLRDHCLATPLTDVSSTAIRQRIQAGEPIGDLDPPAVAKYIEMHNLYR